MAQLTTRQTEILKAVAKEFIETAEPVGSSTVEKKYNLGVSPATIRAEMAQLTNTGYLQKPHPSAGRVPTSMGLKYYVKNLMDPEKLSIAEEVGVKEQVWDHRKDFQKLMEESTQELSRRTRAMAFSVLDNGQVYIYGVSNLLDYREFFDIDVTKTVLMLIDNQDYWLKIVSSVFESNLDQPFYLLIGEELERELLRPCGLIYQTFRFDKDRGAIGVMGPARMSYSKVIPLVDYVADLISEVAV